MLRKILIIIFVASLLGGCANNGQREFEEFLNKKQVLPTEQIKLNIPDVRPVKMKQVKWMVVTKENVASTFNSLEKGGKTPILFGISDDDYENLSLNMLELQNYIESNNIILLEYRKFYEAKK